MIRHATPLDADAVARVLKESYNISSLEEGKEVFGSERARGVQYLVAAEGKEIAGIVTWYVHGLPKHGLAELDRIAVLPQFRGKGVAKELFDALVKDASTWYAKRKGKLRKVFLMTHESNTRAHAFYEKLGMKHETTLRSHYYDGEDERVYSFFI